MAIAIPTYIFLAAPGPTTRSSGTLTFAQARSLADAMAAPYGNWLLASAYGYDLAESINVSYAPWTLYSGCTVTSYTGPVQNNVTWPAYSGNISNGALEIWEFRFYETSSQDAFVVVETGDSVSLALGFTGQRCGLGDDFAIPGAVGSVIDSPRVVANAVAAGAGEFLATHSQRVSLSLALNGEAGWSLSWTTCSLFPDQYGWTGEGYQFSTGANASTGAVDTRQTSSGSCGSPPPITEAIQFGPPSVFLEGDEGSLASQGCAHGDYCYSLPIARASMNVSASNMSLEVLRNNTSDDSIVGYAFLDSSGQVVVSASVPVAGGVFSPWTPGTGTSATVLNPTMSLIVDMGPSPPQGQNDVLWVYGAAPGFTGNYAVSLP